MLRSVEPFFIGTAERVLMAERLKEIQDGAEFAVAAAPRLAGVKETLEQIVVRLP